jgi:CCR4-NOT transcription complex subunit 1
MPFYNQTML